MPSEGASREFRGPEIVQSGLEVRKLTLLLARKWAVEPGTHLRFVGEYGTSNGPWLFSSNIDVQGLGLQTLKPAIRSSHLSLPAPPMIVSLRPCKSTTSYDNILKAF